MKKTFGVISILLSFFLAYVDLVIYKDYNLFYFIFDLFLLCAGVLLFVWGGKAQSIPVIPNISESVKPAIQPDKIRVRIGFTAMILSLTIASLSTVVYLAASAFGGGDPSTFFAGVILFFGIPFIAGLVYTLYGYSANKRSVVWIGLILLILLVSFSTHLYTGALNRHSEQLIPGTDGYRVKFQ